MNRIWLLTVLTSLAALCISGVTEQQSGHMYDESDPYTGGTCLNCRHSSYITSRTLLVLLSYLDVSWSPQSDLITCLQLPRQWSVSNKAHAVDVFFVIEQSVGDLEEKLKFFWQDIKSIVNTGNDVRFGIVSYSVENLSWTQIRGFDSNKLKYYIDKQLGVFDYSGTYSYQFTNKESFQYRSLERNLELVNQILNNEISLQPRTGSDIFIISLLDLSNPISPQSSTSANNLEKTINKLKENIEKLVSNLIIKVASFQSYPLSIQYIFDRDNLAAANIIGDPSLGSMYPDCTHFNKALTLKTILESTDAQRNTLQAHLISNGVISRTLTWKDMKHKKCVHGLIPSLSGHFQLYPTFTNNCHRARKCSNCFCSLIHGWVTKNTLNDSNSEGYDGRSPISTTFSASHEDLARMTDNYTTLNNLPEEKLTIYSKTKIICKDTPIIIGKPKVLQWSPNHAIAKDIVGRKEPLVLQNTVVKSWPAMRKWNWSYISRNFGLDILDSVKCTNTYLTFDPDRRTPLKLNISIPFATRNMTRDEFFTCIQHSDNCSDNFLGHYYFGSVPALLKQDLMPDSFLYNTQKDYESNRQFIWISSSGMITHIHFDQDYNLFIQLIGKKRFTLWSPFQHELMYTYPRIHPMWHKSQVNYRCVDTSKFPAFSKAEAVQIELGPGDMLYVPPYTWHYVETLSPSVSLSTWSHDYNVYDHMNAIYKHDHKFDLIQNPRGQMFVLRLYLDMMIHHLYGVNETTSFFVKLVHTRFSPLTHLFPPRKEDHSICEADVPNQIPTCLHVHGYAKLDMLVIGGHFEALDAEIRDILFMDYVEEITAQVVGVKKMLAFFRYCFLGQEYYITEIGDDEHSLWDYKDGEDES